MTFSISLTPSNSVRLSIAGQLDALTVPDLRPALDKLLAREPPYVDLDLSRLRMIDATGVGTLMAFYKCMGARGRLITFSDLRDQPLAIFRSLGLDRITSQL